MACHSATSVSAVAPRTDSAIFPQQGGLDRGVRRIDQRRKRDHGLDPLCPAGQHQRDPSAEADADQGDPGGVDQGMDGQPFKRHAGVVDLGRDVVIAFGAPRAAVVEVQAMHAKVAQVHRQVEVLLVAGDAVQEEDGRVAPSSPAARYKPPISRHPPSAGPRRRALAMLCRQPGGVGEGTDRGDMIARRLEAGGHGIEGNMRRAGGLPILQPLLPAAGFAVTVDQAGFDTET